jgi:hypothetical protein
LRQRENVRNRGRFIHNKIRTMQSQAALQIKNPAAAGFRSSIVDYFLTGVDAAGALAAAGAEAAGAAVFALADADAAGNAGAPALA